MNDSNPTLCRMWEKKLAALFSDDLSPFEHKALRQHIASCPACESALADYYKMRELIYSSSIPRRPPGIWKLFLPTASELLAKNPSFIQLAVLHRRLYHNLPQPDYARFVGRQQEIDWLLHYLSHNQSPGLVSVTGMSGVGKSALALAVGHHYREHFEELPVQERFEAIIWISAKEEDFPRRKEVVHPGLTSPALGDVYTTIARTLVREDITRFTGKQDILMYKALSAQRTLLILDNINSPDDKEVKKFLHNLPSDTKCLITSRESTNTSHGRKLTGLYLEEAEKMIMAEAKVRYIRLHKEQRLRLAEYSEGLPLPIKLSIARLKNGEPFDQVIEWLNRASDNLPDYCVKEQIDLAHQQNPDAWRLLLVCSLFNQNAGVSPEALGAIANLSSRELEKELTLLHRLALLNQDDDDRFWLLPFIHKHVAAEFMKNDPGGLMIERWLSWTTEFIANYGASLEFHIENVPFVSSEYSNILNAVRWCRKHGRWALLLQFVESMSFYLYLIGLFHELQEVLEAGLQASEILQDNQHKGQFLRLLGRLFWAQGHYEKAQESLAQSQKIATDYDDEVELGRSDNIRFGIFFEQGHFTEAEQIARTMWQHAQYLNNAELKILALYRLSECESYKHRFDSALQWLDQSEQLCKEMGWTRRLAWNLCLRGSTFIQQGNAPVAEPFLTQSLDMAISWHEHNLIALNKQYLAEVYMRTDRPSLAYKMAAEAYDLYERLGMVKKMTKMEQSLLHPERRLPMKHENL